MNRMKTKLQTAILNYSLALNSLEISIRQSLLEEDTFQSSLMLVLMMFGTLCFFHYAVDNEFMQKIACFDSISINIGILILWIVHEISLVKIYLACILIINILIVAEVLFIILFVDLGDDF